MFMGHTVHFICWNQCKQHLLCILVYMNQSLRH
uniref:Uncharacterized protein n=1 Tax=Rhizophora mucronata TaxID=61149 RepID=A0A2P2QIJ1_RHIMU